MSFGSPIRVILARLDGTVCDQAVLGCAADFAKRFHAHVRAIHVRLEPASMPLLGGVDRDGYEGFGKSPEALSEEVASAARAHFDEWASGNGFEPTSVAGTQETPTTEWLEFYGEEPNIIVDSGRFADLIITARPRPDAGLAAYAALEAALFGSERPVLMTPPVNTAIDPFASPVIGWNASPQAIRALSASLPILKAGTDPVTVLAVPDRKSRTDGSQVTEYLSWHGVRAVLAPPSSDRDVGAQLLQLVHERHGGILICGAYSRSRFRQMILGGVTSFLIDRADIPVLMSC